MSVVEVALSARQLASAYTQLSDDERRSFLEAVFDQPANQQVALEVIVEAQPHTLFFPEPSLKRRCEGDDRGSIMCFKEVAFPRSFRTAAKFTERLLDF